MSNIPLEFQLIRAGAGTGKTTCLISEIYSLFQEFRKTEARNPRLIVCTFTRKASQELKERLFERAEKELREIKNEKIFATADESSLFLKYIQSSSLYISTIDGILNRLIKRYGYQLSLKPDFQLHSSSQNEKLFNSFADEFIFEKNFSLLKKIPYPQLRELFIFYFKSRMKYGEISFYDDKDFELFNQDKSSFLNLSKSELDSKNLERENLNLLQGMDAKTFKEIFKKEEESFMADEFIPVFKEFHQAGEDFFHQFLEKKKQESNLDMEDLLLFSLYLLREKPKTAERFSKEWDYWFIDEYQDTSWIQEQIIDRLSGFKNVFCVGDPMQSIYSFRGADPNVFKRREKALEGRVKSLNINYRSTKSLVHFYNDFFPEEEGFLKIKPSSENQTSGDDLCTYFFTYEKEGRKEKAMEALHHYIARLIQRGFTYSDIAVLSSKNEDLFNIAGYMRSKGIPVAYSGVSFSKNRLILDALFLLKFLINPHDDTNLKALLRTPYFRLSDQDLADSSYDHKQFCESKERISFWSFIKENISSELCVQSLELCLQQKKEQGIVHSFERALIDCAFMDLSYFQDSTGASEANLWKLISLLNKEGLSALDLFYSLMEDEENAEKEAFSCEQEGDFIELMTIHKSKGLQFKNVIIMDFSIKNSGFRAGNSDKFVIYDEWKQKMAFSIPIGGREQQKIRSYGHKIYQEKKKNLILSERERLFYVAMTRAEKSLALFVPDFKPDRNSWLESVKFFKNQSLLPESDDKKEVWRMNEGHYKRKNYSFCVLSSSVICQLPEKFIKTTDFSSFFSSNKPKPSLNGDTAETNEEKVFVNGDTAGTGEAKASCNGDKTSRDEAKIFVDGDESDEKKKDLKKDSSQNLKTDSMKFIPPEKGQKQLLKPDFLMKSAQDFIKESSLAERKQSGTHKKATQEALAFSLIKEQNLFFKAHLGSHLHFFIQKLAYHEFEDVNQLIKKSLLSAKYKKLIEQALIYIHNLKKPPLSLLMKSGFPEWSFKIKRQNVILQGQIDLWAWDSKSISVFEYKSSLSQSASAKKQLIFYSWILNEMYHPDKIEMYEIYPFEKTFYFSTYSPAHKSSMEDWLNKA